MNLKKQIKVIEMLDFDNKVVLNVGSDDGINLKQRFLIYALGDEFIDPDTNENLGHLEIVKGTGIVEHLQPKMCTVKSDRIKKSVNTKIIMQEAPWPALSVTNKKVTESVPEITELPFDEPKKGDYARIIESYAGK